MEKMEKKRRRVSSPSKAAGLGDQLQEPPSSSDDQSSDQSMLDSAAEATKTVTCIPPGEPPGCQDNDAAADNIVKVEAMTTGSAKKKRHRRRRKAGEHHQGRNSGGGGKWKPYDQLTWEERRKLDEKAGRRATKKREEQIACGQAMAPDNTTQFLMAQHGLEYDPNTPNAVHGFADDGTLLPGNLPCRRDRTLSGSMSDDDELSEESEQIYLEKDFSDTYEQFRIDRLLTLTKEDMLKEYLEMEARLNGVYACLKDLHLTPVSIADCFIAGEAKFGHDPVASLKDELLYLRTENVRLAAENEQLKHGTLSVA